MIVPKATALNVPNNQQLCGLLLLLRALQVAAGQWHHFSVQKKVRPLYRQGPSNKANQ
jgi:hypothetical protein